MWFHKTNIPDELVASHRGGRLVIFVGAGASMGAPSNLPDFRALVQELADPVGVEVPEKTALDEVLSELVRRKVPVHGRVHRRLSDPTSSPNGLHLAVVRLAAAAPSLRIVTTNFDQHLSSVLDEKGIAREEYAGPALPLGADFSGIVYLHGRLEPPARMVLTAEDFGSGYLTDAWAARFLERMFASFDVLFVGYGHNDTVMNYVARGLRGGRKRYLLTPDPENSYWDALGIHPIGYPNEDDSHGELEACLRRWADVASMDVLDHDVRVADLVAAIDTLSPEEDSYLQAVIADPSLVTVFTSHAHGSSCLRFAANLPAFMSLFDPHAESTPAAYALARWLAEHYAVNQPLSAEALQLVRSRGNELSAQLWVALGRAMHNLDGPRPDWLDPWLSHLIESATNHDLLLLTAALHRYAGRPPDRLAFRLLDFLSAPVVGLRPVEVRTRETEHGLSNAWLRVFKPRIDSCASELAEVAVRQLAAAHALGVTSDLYPPTHDRCQFVRPALTKPPDNWPQEDATGVLVDIAVACIDWLVEAGDPRAQALLCLWEGSEAPIVRRLVLHGWTSRSDVSADKKLTWLLGRQWLFEYTLEVEVYGLIQAAAPVANGAVLVQLVAAVVAGPGRGDLREEDSVGRVFNRLSWILDARPGQPEASAEVDRLLASCPDLRRPGPPDRFFHVSSWSREESIPPEVLHRELAIDAAAAMSALGGLSDSPTLPGMDTWDAQRLIADTVKLWPEDGFRTLENLAPDSPLIEGALEGWAQCSVDAELALRIVQRVSQLDLTKWAGPVSYMLAGFRNDQGPTPAWHQLPEARGLASACWQLLPDNPPEVLRDAFTTALNHPGGRLAFFWLHVVQGEREASGDDWSGFDPDLAAQLTALLQAPGTKSEMAAAIFLANMIFLHAADPAWCERALLPQLSWDTPVRPLTAWDAYLRVGRPNDRLMALGLRDRYHEVLEHLNDLDADGRTNLCRHLAWLTLYDEESKDWPKTVAALDDDDIREQWIVQLGYQLQRLDPPKVEAQWARWIDQYWADRLDGSPRSLTSSEARLMVDWLPRLSGSFTRGVDLAIRSPVGLDVRNTYLDAITEAQFETQAPAVATLVNHLLTNSQKIDFWTCRRVQDVVHWLQSLSTPVDARPVVVAAHNAGCQDALSWLRDS